MSLPYADSLLLTSVSKLLCDNVGSHHLVWVYPAATKQNHLDLQKTVVFMPGKEKLVCKHSDKCSDVHIYVFIM